MLDRLLVLEELLGWNRSLCDQEAMALASAVRSGVGLLNEYWTGDYETMRSSPHVQALMLAASPIYCHHAPQHGADTPAHLVCEHPVLAGLRPGMPMSGRACGPIYKPARNATVHAVGDARVTEQEHGIAGLGPSPIPVCLSGTLGHGRVWIINAFPHERLAPFLPVPFPDYLTNLLLWLAEPRRQQPGGDEALNAQLQPTRHCRIPSEP